MGYYKKDVQSVLAGMRNVLNSLNFVVFLIYMILLIRVQLGEKERILSLNKQLNETNEELKRANLKLEKYAQESVEAAETRERNRLAMEIHDTLGHALTGIITGIEACTVLMDAAPEATKVQLKAIAEVARQGATDVRRSIKALRPDALEKMDLEKALMQMMDEMRSSTNVEIVYECSAGLHVFNEDEENVIYRIVQETITNAIRHGRADRIIVRIGRKFDMLGIHIEDNGRGCNEIQKGFGLHHMEERLSMLQGSLKYSGENGFIVEAQIPIRWGMEEKKDD
ncbi:MAG: sensor histidine kinase [Eubacterium sp.]|nr:sensor histidine kinase [Eubacterium sp.]